MAFNAQPDSWISSWLENGTTVSFDLADLSQELTAAEADAATGDWRSCLYSLLDHSYEYLNGLAEADKPAQLSIARAVQKHTDTVMKITYTTTVYVSVVSTDVNAE